MTVFKSFLKCASKYKIHFLITIGIFVALSFVFSSAGKSNQTEFENHSMEIGLINQSDSELASLLAETLLKGNRRVEIQDDENHIREMVFMGSLDAVVVIPENFEEKLIHQDQAVHVYFDPTYTNGYFFDNMVTSFLTMSMATYENHEFDLKALERALPESIDVEYVNKSVNLEQKQHENTAIAFNYGGYILMMLYLMLITMAMSDFHLEESKQRILISSTSFLKFQVGLYSGQLFLGFLITLSVFFIPTLLNLEYLQQTDISKYILGVTAFSLAIMAIVYTVNQITSNKTALNAIQLIISLGLSMISGIFVPQEFLGEGTLRIAKFFPAYYFVKINNTQNLDSHQLLEYVGILLAFSIFFFVLGLSIARQKRKV